MSDNKLTRPELIRAVSERTGFTLKDVTTILKAQDAAVQDALAAGQSVALAGGVLKAYERAAREGVKPGTTERIQIPAKTAVRFKAGGKLLDTLN